MDFLTILSYVLAIVETGALIGMLIYVTLALQEKKMHRKRQGKKGGKSNEQVQKAVKAHFRNAGIFFAVYVILNFIRRHSGIF
jgi:phosphotransferase system  glucose/maltose/N-acetylglucosamine-specific IIC component